VVLVLTPPAVEEAPLPLVVDDVAVDPTDDCPTAEVVGTVNPVADETTVLVHEHDGSNESIVKTYVPLAEVGDIDVEETTGVVADPDTVVGVAVVNVSDTVKPVADVTIVLVQEQEGSNESIVKIYAPLEEAALTQLLDRAKMVMRNVIRAVEESIFGDLGAFSIEIRA